MTVTSPHGEERYRNLFETAMVGMYQTRIEDGQMLEANQALVDLMGYDSKEELLSEFRTSEHYADPRRREDLLELLQKHGSVRWFEIDATKRDGSILPIAISATLYQDRGVLEGVVIDLTAQKAAEEQLKRSRERYRDLVETIEDWIWEVDAAGRYTYVSPRVTDILGYRPDELLGKKPFHLMPPKEAETVSRVFNNLVSAKRRIVGLENVNTHKDGHEVVLETSGVPFLDAHGKLLGYRGVDRDVTERKRAEEERRRLEAQLHHAQKLESLGVLAGGIAHDFNNILVAILGNADLALSEVGPRSQLRDNLVGIAEAAKRAAELCKQMLAYAGKERFVVEPVNLSDVVSEMTHILEVSISKKAILRYSFATDLPAIEADAAQLHQVVMNLITNASDALGEERGVIAISTGCIYCDREYLFEAGGSQDMAEGTYVYLEVTDSGIGMDESTRERIFEPFFTTKFSGRGLGLASTLGIVQGHRGALKVTSEPGRGSTFRVLFPTVARRVTVAEESSRDGSEWVGVGTVLLVDDEDAVRSVGKRMLQLVGFDVVTASGGRDALRVFSENPEDVALVVLDLTMPDMDGEETFEALRAIRRDVPVLLSSGHSELEVMQRFKEKSIAGFIQKPYELAILREMVRSAIRAH
jgi:two-component system cell cycle sensor histidine kinase/response regulator CckA